MPSLEPMLSLFYTPYLSCDCFLSCFPVCEPTPTGGHFSVISPLGILDLRLPKMFPNKPVILISTGLLYTCYHLLTLGSVAELMHPFQGVTLERKPRLTFQINKLCPAAMKRILL